MKAVVLELIIPGEAPRICASTINIIQRHSGLTGSQLKPMSLCDRIAPKRIGSQRIARGSHEDRTKLDPPTPRAPSPAETEDPARIE